MVTCSTALHVTISQRHLCSFNSFFHYFLNVSEFIALPNPNYLLISQRDVNTDCVAIFLFMILRNNRGTNKLEFRGRKEWFWGAFCFIRKRKTGSYLQNWKGELEEEDINKQINKWTTTKPRKNNSSLLWIWWELYSLLESRFDFLRALFSIGSLKQKQENTLDTPKQHWIMAHTFSASSLCLFADREVIATTEMSAKSTSKNFFSKVGREISRKRRKIQQT